MQGSLGELENNKMGEKRKNKRKERKNRLKI